MRLTWALARRSAEREIIKNVAMNMVKLEVYQGFAASLSATLCLMLATFTGMPVSTTACEDYGHYGRGGRPNEKAP